MLLYLQAHINLLRVLGLAWQESGCWSTSLMSSNGHWAGTISILTKYACVATFVPQTDPRDALQPLKEKGDISSTLVQYVRFSTVNITSEYGSMHIGMPG